MCAFYAVVHDGAVIALAVTGLSFVLATVMYLRSPVVAAG
jgi:hypothetical protein